MSRHLFRARHWLATLLIALAGTALPVPGRAALPAAVDGQPMPSLAPMLQRVTPAVVNISTRTRVQVRDAYFDDPMVRQFFGLPPTPRERVEQSLGSGVIVDAARGYILTNNHVVAGADDISVTLQDGRSFKGRLIGTDPATDVAVVQIQASNLQALPMADSSTLRVGDYVVAVGEPFGLGQTVTAGIVSALGRSGLGDSSYQNFIQTDASINPGNSGGALVDLQGRLVGINTASFNPQGSMAGNIGLGLAIPSNLARGVVDQLLKNNGVVIRGTLGLETQNISAQMVQGLGLENTRGALVTRVLPGTAAAAAGVQPGDVVTAFNGERVDSAEALHNQEGLSPVGSTATLDVRRDGKPLQLRATLKEQARAVAGDTLDPRLAGATFTDLPESLRQSGISGVLVSQVKRGSRAAQNGLAGGDVVLAASTGEFGDLAGWRANFSQQPPQRLVLRIVRGGTQGDVLMR